MDLQKPFRLVGPTLDGDVLGVLARGHVALTGRGVARALPDASYTGVRHALRRLTEQGIVRRQSVGRAHLYQLDRDHLAAPWIEGLASLRLELIDRLRAAIDGWQTPPAVALLYGSAARGEADRESDIDILVIRPAEVDEDDIAWREQLMGLEAAASAWTGNDAR
ncbi:MAG: nucleotidyltransferase domain-containing protein, partial [Actinobacteria bacterium]|nr:nucleotidyltransferase domain-containing protein [Actinomycetota bacterium]